MKLFLTSLTCFLLTIPIFANELVILKKGNHVIFNSEFNEVNAAKLKYDILNLDQKPFGKVVIPYNYTQKVIYLIIDSPGGDLYAGLRLIDFLASQPYEFKPIIDNGAASMGFILYQFLGERLITPSGILMSHRAKGGFGGELGHNGSSQFDSRYNFIKRRLKRVDDHIVKRTKGKQTMESYLKLYDNEYYCDGLDCVKDGFADKVIDLTCDADLTKKVTKKEVISFYGLQIPIQVTSVDCPLVGVLDVKVDQKRDGKFISIESSNVNVDLRKKIKDFLNIK